MKHDLGLIAQVKVAKRGAIFWSASKTHSIAGSLRIRTGRKLRIADYYAIPIRNAKEVFHVTRIEVLR